MNRQALKRLQALEDRYKTACENSCIAFLDEGENGQYIIKENVYRKNGQVSQRNYTITAASAEEAAKLYKEPEGCTDCILFIKDFGEMWPSDEVAGKLAEMMTTEELRQLITEPTDHGTWVDDNGNEVTSEEYNRFFNQIMVKYAGRLMHEMGIPQQDLQQMELEIIKSLNKKMKG